MSRRVDRDGDCDWRVEFIRPPIPGDDRCIMLYGSDGETVGPLSMPLAEAWIDYCDNARRSGILQLQIVATAN